METPEAKAQAAQMASFMSVRHRTRHRRRRGCRGARRCSRCRGCVLPPQNPEVQKRMVEMQNDPEMKDFFDAVKVRRTRSYRRRSERRLVFGASWQSARIAS